MHTTNVQWFLHDTINYHAIQAKLPLGCNSNTQQDSDYSVSQVLIDRQEIVMVWNPIKSLHRTLHTTIIVEFLQAFSLKKNKIIHAILQWNRGEVRGGLGWGLSGQNERQKRQIRNKEDETELCCVTGCTPPLPPPHPRGWWQLTHSCGNGQLKWHRMSPACKADP